MWLELFRNSLADFTVEEKSEDRWSCLFEKKRAPDARRGCSATDTQPVRASFDGAHNIPDAAGRQRRFATTCDTLMTQVPVERKCYRRRSGVTGNPVTTGPISR